MADNTTVIDAQQAYKLPIVDVLENSKSFIMVDRDSNSGFLLNYNTLATAILSKIYQEDMPDDGFKVYIVD